ncbi:hypothetical protein CTAYLR_001445 [Chrysophaeum taylorii]|uniref:Uncharacterized protein n=1 Tax=Chrysophaeum taylorii TaxID=2483200 RepID=A0AAD7U902_9STRA|nr:hypothetical protein CTAYLR_001445 [Chrysophaeum taylorii]
MSRRFARLELVLEKMLESLQQRLVEVDPRTLFEELDECFEPPPLDMADVSQQVVSDLRRHFRSVCEARELEHKLGNLEASGRAPCPPLRHLAESPEDLVNAERVRRKIDLKRRLEDSLCKLAAENDQLRRDIKATYDSI